MFLLTTLENLPRVEPLSHWNASLASLIQIDRQIFHPSCFGVDMFGVFFDYAEQVDHFPLKYLLDLLKIKMIKSSFPLCIGNKVKQTAPASQLDHCKSQGCKRLLSKQLLDLHKASPHSSWWPLSTELRCRKKAWGAMKDWTCLQLSRAWEPPR